MLADFFKDSTGQASMSRLLTALSFVPATVELYRINSSDALGLYLGAYVIGYVGGKFGEAWQARKQGDGQ